MSDLDFAGMFQVAGVDDRAVRENRLAGKASATQRALRVNWSLFEQWCASRDLTPLPIALDVLERYLLDCADLQGLSPNTVAQRVWAINTAHRMAGQGEPGASEQIKLAMAGIRRRCGRRTRQAEPLMLDDLAGLADYSLREKRDRALLLVMWAGALRRSEASAVDVEHLSPAPHGLDLLIPRSKTDQSSLGQTVAILAAGSPKGPCPVRALESWLAGAQISEGPVFRSIDNAGRIKGRLTDGSINRVVKARCRDLGLDPSAYSGHSLRAGAATYWGMRGKPVPVIARHGRWKTADMVLHYFRGDVARALAGEY